MTAERRSVPAPGAPAGRRGASAGALVVLSLSLAMATGSTTTYSLGALSPFLVQDLGLTAAINGLLLSGLYVVAASSSGAIGHLTDRIDPAWIIAGGAACSLVACVVFALAPNLVVLGVAVLFAGLAMAASNPGSNGVVARFVAQDWRAYVTGLKQSGATGAGLYIAALMPPVAVALGWRPASLLAALIPIASLGAVLLSRRQRPRLPDEEIASAAPGPHRRRRWLVWLTVYALFLGVATGACNGFYVLYASQRLHFTAVAAGLVFALLAISSVLARVLWAQLANRGIPSGVLLAAVGVVGALSALLCLAAPILGSWLIWIAAAAAGASILGWNALGMVTIMRKVRPRAVGRSSAQMLQGFFAGLAIGPLVFGLLVEVGGYPLGWAFQLAVMLIAIGIAIVFGRVLGAAEPPPLALEPEGPDA